MKRTIITLSLAIAALLAASCGHRCEFTDKQFETPEIPQGMQIHATFLDEISWDIPHQNWGVKEWASTPL